MRKFKIVFCILVVISCFVVSFLPVFAADDAQVHLIVSADNTSYTSTTYITGDINGINYNYSYETSMLVVSATSDQMDTQILYSTIVSTNVSYTLHVEYDNNTTTDMTYTKSNVNYNYNITIPTTATFVELYVNVGVYGVTYDQGYDDGIQYVIDHPNTYNLYSLSQYEEYGQQRFTSGESSGKQYVINYPSQFNLYTSQQYQDVVNGNGSNTNLADVANVGLTSVFNYFTYFVSQTGVFGISLGAIIVSGIIVLLVYAIFKIVKG